MALVQPYVLRHSGRWSQCLALIDAVVPRGGAPAVQFLGTVARQVRTDRVRGKARMWLDHLARTRGITSRELERSAVPRAGLDAQGRLVLDYGTRSFTATLDPSCRPVLRGAAGEVLKGLPAPRKGDDPLKLEEAKQTLVSNRKLIAQTVRNQTSRLHEAMGARTAWSWEAWTGEALTHPVLGPMLRRLVWMDEGGTCFRPVEDGSWVDAGGAGVVPEPSTVRLAHAALVGPEEALAWIRH